MTRKRKEGEVRLTDQLKQMIEQADTKTKLMIFNMIDEGEKAYAKIKEDVNAESAANFIAERLDDEINRILTLDKKKVEERGGISCKKGCYYCCEQRVDMSKDEAILLYEYILEEKIEVDWDKVVRQSKVHGDDWHTQPREDWTCPLLGEDKSCKVYKHRPHVCRKYMVVSDPELCNTELDPSEDPVHVVSLATAEIYMCSSWNQIDDVDTLPKQLIKMTKERS